MKGTNEGNGADGAPKKHKRHHRHHRHRHKRDEEDHRGEESAEQQRQDAAAASPPLGSAPTTRGDKQTLSDQFEERMRVKLEDGDHDEAPESNDAEAGRNPAGEDQESDDDVMPEVRKTTVLDQYEQRVQMKLEMRNEEALAASTPTSVCISMSEDHSHARENEDHVSAPASRHISIPVRPGAQTIDATVQPVSSDNSQEPHKNSVWKSVANLFSKRQRRVDAEASGSIAPMVDENCGHVLIPEATLVEPNADAARYKWWKHVAIASTIVAIVVVVAGVVATSSNNAKTEEIPLETTSDPKLVTPEDIREAQGYNFWIKPVEFGERAIYYGAVCNAMATSCDKCGLYEARMPTNEIIGECSYCEPCSMGGFQADCTNIAGGVFNCGYETATEPMPEGFDYEQWICPYQKGERKVCTGFNNCYPGTGLCGSCGVYELKVNSTEVVGKCASCQTCAAGGVNADCSNVGHGRFKCYFPEDEV